MASITFDNARAYANENRGPRPTVVTDGLLVTGEVKGAHIHDAFGSENLAELNMGYAQIFAATNKYYGKPLVGINGCPLS